MIVRLYPEQISRHWEIIKYALERSLPPIASENEDRMNKLLESMLIGQMHAWIGFRKEGERPVIEAVLITTPVEDTNSGAADLMLYALYGYSLTSTNTWEDGLSKLRAWAREMGFARIVAYTNSPQVLELVKRFGGRADYTYVSFDTKE